MSQRMVTLAVAATMLAGCGKAKSWLGGPGGSTKGPKPPEFLGHYLAVHIAGRVTKKINPAGNDNRWWVEPCGPNPTIVFDLDTKRLGPRMAQELIINPMKGNAVDHSITYWDDRVQTMKAGLPLKLSNLNRSVGGKPPIKVPGLPKGKYMFKLHVNGTKGRWDEQFIVVNVK